VYAKSFDVSDQRVPRWTQLFHWYMVNLRIIDITDVIAYSLIKFRLTWKGGNGAKERRTNDRLCTSGSAVRAPSQWKVDVVVRKQVSYLLIHDTLELEPIRDFRSTSFIVYYLGPVAMEMISTFR
jgi:hypothetical protein